MDGAEKLLLFSVSLLTIIASVMLMSEKLYTTGEVAEIFGFSYVAVKKWAYSGKIK